MAFATFPDSPLSMPEKMTIDNEEEEKWMDEEENLPSLTSMASSTALSATLPSHNASPYLATPTITPNNFSFEKT